MRAAANISFSMAQVGIGSTSGSVVPRCRNAKTQSPGQKARWGFSRSLEHTTETNVLADSGRPLSPTCSLSVRASPRGRRCTDRLLESARECGLGVVADNIGDLCEWRAGVAELLSRDLHAPISEVLNRRHAEQANEAISQCRTRQTDLAAVSSESRRTFASFQCR